MATAAATFRIIIVQTSNTFKYVMFIYRLINAFLCSCHIFFEMYIYYLYILHVDSLCYSNGSNGRTRYSSEDEHFRAVLLE